MNCSTPGLPVHHQIPEFTQTHVHWVSDAIQPSHPLSSPSPPAANPSQHKSLFQWAISLHEVAIILELQLQHHSLQRNPRADHLQNGLVGFPCNPRDFQNCPNLQITHLQNLVRSLSEGHRRECSGAVLLKLPAALYVWSLHNLWGCRSSLLLVTLHYHFCHAFSGHFPLACLILHSSCRKQVGWYR